MSGVKMLAVILTACFAALITGSASAQSTLRCESTDGRPHNCSFEGAGTVQLSRQLTRDACIEGQSWGVNGNTIWVDRGCRADFTLAASVDRNRENWNTPRAAESDDQQRQYRTFGDSDNRQRQNRMVTVVCESTDGRRQRCPADTLGQVTLGRQLTRDNRCIEGRTWGYDRDAIWVDGGCRAEFFIADNGGMSRDRGRSQAMQTVVCESRSSQRSYCRADTRFGVQLMREMSRNNCVVNRTWGFDGKGVWVSNGCRAEFGLKTRY
jgi:Protein of unknown function (DUF3011)